MDTENIMEELILLPKDILRMILNYDEKIITLCILLKNEDFEIHEEIFVDYISENMYKIKTNNSMFINKEYKQLGYIVDTKFVVQFILDKLIYKHDNGNTINMVDMYFIDIEKYNSVDKKDIDSDINDYVVELENNHIEKEDYNNEHFKDKNIDELFISNIVGNLKNYLDIQPTIML